MPKAGYYKIAVTAFLLVQVLAFSQNLVPNGYFENYTSCPNALTQINKATAWYSVSFTPDYFNNCASYTNNINVPYTGFGYQQDCCGGEGYGGVIVYSIHDTNASEYMQIKLNDTLKAGKKYLAGMQINLSNNSDYAIKTLGMYFTNSSVQADQQMAG